MIDELTVLILVKNAETTLENTLINSIDHAKVLVLVDDANRATQSILNQHLLQVKVLNTPANLDFAEKRNLLLKNVTTEWLLYLDADEVVSDELWSEINNLINLGRRGVFGWERINFFLGKKMYNDKVIRLFHKSLIDGWTGKVHESPVYKGEISWLSGKMKHQTHLDITTMLTKTNEWSEYEAELRLKAKHPPISWWRIIRIGMTFFWGEYLGKKLFKYGNEGLFESYFQGLDKIIVYTKLWEKQQAQIKE